MRYFVVSDVHSFYDELMYALNSKGFDKKNPQHKLIVCGDLFDRGEQVIEVFEFVKELQAQDRLIYIRGNHEDLLKECVNELAMGEYPSYHHFSNGTVNTIAEFCDFDYLFIEDPSWCNKVCKTMKPILDFIDKNCVDYAEIGDYIFVHGWIPYDLNNATKDDWYEARWYNGMQMWYHPNNRIDGKTIVCGHYHANYGHAHIHNICSEWGDDAIFEPFIDDGIIAIDSCAAYSGKINCIVIEN